MEIEIKIFRRLISRQQRRDCSIVKLELGNSILAVETNGKFYFSDVGFEIFWIKIERDRKAPYLLFSKYLTITKFRIEKPLISKSLVAKSSA